MGRSPLIPYETSPLLQRARARSLEGGPRIPRRGRIRVVLLCTGILGAALLLRSRAARQAGDGTRPPAAESKALPAVPTPKAPRDEYSFEELSALLRRHAVRPQAAEEVLEAGRRALRVHYSIDTSLQRHAALLLRRYRPRYGAMAMVESRSGRVLLLASYVHESEPYLGRDLYARNYFPAASLFKVVAAAGAVERGGLIASSPLKQVGRNHTLYRAQLDSAPAGYRTVSLAEAFAYSINPAFGRIGIYVLGREGLREYARRFGFDEPLPFEFPVDIAELGFADSTFAQAEIASGFNRETNMPPIFGALMCAGIAEDGVMPAPRVVDSVFDVRGNRRVYVAEPRPWRLAVQPSTAAEVANLMKAVIRYGTARESFADVKKSRRMSAMEYGGKTGSITRDGMGRVDWFAGFLRDAQDERLRVGIAVVTVHGEYWTVRSSYLAAQMLRRHVRGVDHRAQAHAAMAAAGEEQSDDDD